MNELSSLVKLYQKVADEKISFGVVSSYRNSNSNIENETSYKELRKLVRQMEKGFVELKGGYDCVGVRVLKRAILIVDISKDKTVALGKKYDQYSILYKDNNEFSEIECATGETVNSFHISGDFNFEHFKKYFSHLFNGTHPEKLVNFILEEEDNSVGMKMFYSKISCI